MPNDTPSNPPPPPSDNPPPPSGNPPSLPITREDRVTNSTSPPYPIYDIEESRIGSTQNPNQSANLLPPRLSLLPNMQDTPEEIAANRAAAGRIHRTPTAPVLSFESAGTGRPGTSPASPTALLTATAVGGGVVSV